MSQDTENPTGAVEEGSTCGPQENPEGKAGAAEEYATDASDRDAYMIGSGTLKRSLRLLYVYAIATGAIFTFMAYWDGMFLTSMGPLTFAGFAIMGLCVLPIAYVYAEWATMCPTCGVELVYGTVGLNKHFGFISTWFILAAWLAVPPAGVIGIVSWISYMLDLNLSVGWIALISCIIIAAYMVLSLYEISLAGQIQTFMLMFGLAVCVIAGIIWLTSSAWTWDNFHPWAQTGFGGGNKAYGLLIGLALLVTPYFGFEIVPNMVEEGDFPIKKQSKAILGSILTCTALYIFYYFCLSGMLPWGKLTGDGTAAPFASFRAYELNGMAHGGWAVWLWVFGIGAAVFPITTSVLGFWLSGVRMLYAMGRQNFLPKSFAKCNKHHQPILPNILIAVLSVAAIITMNYTSFLQAFFCLMAFSCAVCYTIISIAGIRAAILHPDWERPYKIPGGMFMRVLSTIIAATFAVLTTLGQPGWRTMAIYMGFGFVLWMWMVFGKWRKEKVWMETPEGIKEY
jgi:APA family basic amino acid/polyamine antiporter